MDTHDDNYLNTQEGRKLPLKVNPAGVIPVIFASSITAAPAAIFQFLTATGHNTQWVRVAQSLFATTTVSGIAMYALLIILLRNKSYHLSKLL